MGYTGKSGVQQLDEKDIEIDSNETLCTFYQASITKTVRTGYLAQGYMVQVWISYDEIIVYTLRVVRG